MPPKRKLAAEPDMPMDSPLGARAQARTAEPSESGGAAEAADDDAMQRIRQRTIRSLSASMFLQFFTSTMTQQAQIQVALRLSQGNRALVISRMSYMQSIAAAIQARPASHFPLSFLPHFFDPDPCSLTTILHFFLARPR